MAKSQTQSFMGRHQLVKRLTSQVGNRGKAIAILRARGQMEKNSEELTTAGKARDNMTAGERAKARAAKASGKATTAFQYDPRTNAATLKRR